MFTLEFNNDQITPALGRIAAALGDMAPVMQDLAELWLESTQDRMARGEQPDGAPFAPRSPVTLEQYAAQGGGFGNPARRCWFMIRAWPGRAAIQMAQYSAPTWSGSTPWMPTIAN